MLANPTARERGANARMGDEDAAEALSATGRLEGRVGETLRGEPPDDPRMGRDGSVGPGPALLLSDLGITKSHSRPYVSDDNPFSEAQFKTLKYRPGFPERFGSIQDAKSFCRTFFNWYNNAHYHSGLNWLTPAMVHSGQTGPVLARRQHALDRARRQHPERFVNAPRKVAGPPDKVWINPPDNSQAIA